MCHGAELAPHYTVPVTDLTRHVFVTGVTGAGKTNTVFTLLDGAHRSGTPLLVLEPAKAEYRALLRHPRIGPDLQVFTLSDETVSPLRLNPFEAEPGTPVQMHLDLLRSLFVASFGMWDTLPQVLERCLFEIYADRGWDIAGDGNPRLGAAPGDERAAAFPTLADLAGKAAEVIAELGYEDKISDNLRAALVTRVNALRIGGKGAMLDTPGSTPSEQLFTRPTVLELERLGDDDDKAFLMGLVLIKLAEYRRARGYHDSVRHLLVIEEAHRLLAGGTPKPTDLGGDPKMKAVTAFANLLAEVRVYGQGVVIADQVPVKLAPDVIKNTNLKIVHRLVAEDDRKAVGATMAMRQAQLTALTTLGRGTAAMFSEGDDAPILVTPRPVKDGADPPPDDQVAAHMRGRIQVSRCRADCPAGSAQCRAAATLAEDPAIRAAADRAFTTALALSGKAPSLWQGVLDAAAPALTRRPDLDVTRIAPCLAGRLCRAYAARRGAAAGWTYAATERLDRALLGAVLGEPGAPGTLATVVDEVCTRTADPYPRCSKICGPAPGPCRYRFDAGRRAATAEVRLDIARTRGEAEDTRNDQLKTMAIGSAEASRAIHRRAERRLGRPAAAHAVAGGCLRSSASAARRAGPRPDRRHHPRGRRLGRAGASTRLPRRRRCRRMARGSGPRHDPGASVLAIPAQRQRRDRRRPWDRRLMMGGDRPDRTGALDNDGGRADIDRAARLLARQAWSLHGDQRQLRVPTGQLPEAPSCRLREPDLVAALREWNSDWASSSFTSSAC
ncbi:ATP-binding protein [Amycolatopsis sp. lyj-23]|uniref:ATP-binding protein n=1 Tax=Amycolatopsis sp. lyj-23 TaxID=2789283 RepID=UPI00397E1AAE